MVTTADETEVRLKLKEEIEEVGKTEKENLRIKGYGLGWRHIITLHVFAGCFINYALRVNLSVGIVAMLNHSSLKASRQAGSDFSTIDLPNYSGKVVVSTADDWHFCQDNSGNVTKKPMKDGPFEWDEQLQGIILASFFYGYIVTQIPGGFLSGSIGPKWVFGIGTVWTAILTLLTPLAAELGAGYLIALRFFEGFGEGVTWPAMQALFANWAPPAERSQLPSFAASGTLFGTLVAFILSGILADSTFLGGWPAIFYVFGIMGCVWFVFWSIFVESSPEKHRWISKPEKTYIVRSLQAEGRQRVTFSDMRWSEIARSLPLWASIISHFTYNWSLYVLLTGLPLYFKDVLGFDVKSNGVASALPYLCQGIIQASAGKLADLMRSHCGLSTTVVRKILDCSGHLLPAIFVISVGFVGCNHQLALALLVLAVGLAGLCGGGFLFNFLDLGPQYAGITYSISNTFATIPGIIGPSVTGALIKGAHGADAIYAWRNVFFIAGGFYFFSTIFYFIFAKGEIQSWAKSKEISSDLEEKEPAA